MKSIVGGEQNTKSTYGYHNGQLDYTIPTYRRAQDNFGDSTVTFDGTEKWRFV